MSKEIELTYSRLEKSPLKKHFIPSYEEKMGEKLAQYIEKLELFQKNNPARKYRATLWGFNIEHGIELTKKLATAKKILSSIHDLFLPISFTDEEIIATKNGELKKILSEVKQRPKAYQTALKAYHLACESRAANCYAMNLM